MEGSGEKEIFTKGLGSNQKEGEGRGWGNRNFLLSFHRVSPYQTSFAELVTIPCLKEKPLLQESVWDVLLKSEYCKGKKCREKKESVVACWFIEDQILKTGIQRNTRQSVLTNYIEILEVKGYIL